jgi:predicted nucleic acid-binding protein
MLVIDASATADLVLARPSATVVARHVADHEHDLHAPHLLDVEVLSAIRRLVATRVATTERAVEAITDLLDLPIARYLHDVLAPRVWELRKHFSAHDATYLALAEALTDGAVPLLTTDRRFARAIRAHTAIDALAV